MCGRDKNATRAANGVSDGDLFGRSLAITARVLVGGDSLGWLYAASAVACIGGAPFVARRMISKMS